MNTKVVLFSIVVAAIVGCVRADSQPGDDDYNQFSPLLEDEEVSQFQLYHNDDDETAALKGSQTLFSDYCLEMRDYVQATLAGETNKKVAAVFKFVSRTFTDSLQEVGAEGKQAIEEGEQMIALDYKNMASAFGTVWNTMKTATQDVFAAKYADFKEDLEGESFLGAIKKTCQVLPNEMRDHAEGRLREVKKELIKSPNSAEFADVISHTELSNLSCITLRRVRTVALGCDLLHAAIPVLRW